MDREAPPVDAIRPPRCVVRCVFAQSGRRPPFAFRYIPLQSRLSYSDRECTIDHMYMNRAWVEFLYQFIVFLPSLGRGDKSDKDAGTQREVIRDALGTKPSTGVQAHQRSWTVLLTRRTCRPCGTGMPTAQRLSTPQSTRRSSTTLRPASRSPTPGGRA
jgi:hypothetical protein